MKNTLLFIHSMNILVHLLTVNMKNCLTPKNLKMCDPILVTLLKMRPHYSQSSRHNATPSSGTSPLASYKEIPPPPGQKLCLNSMMGLLEGPGGGGVLPQDGFQLPMACMGRLGSAQTDSAFSAIIKRVYKVLT